MRIHDQAVLTFRNPRVPPSTATALTLRRMKLGPLRLNARITKGSITITHALPLAKRGSKRRDGEGEGEGERDDVEGGLCVERPNGAEPVTLGSGASVAVSVKGTTRVSVIWRRSSRNALMFVRDGPCQGRYIKWEGGVIPFAEEKIWAGFGVVCVVVGLCTAREWLRGDKKGTEGKEERKHR